MQQPVLLTRPDGSGRTEGIVFVVFAPFGSDEVLSHFPDDRSVGLLEHPLLRNLQKVAAAGVHVVALIDLVDDDSWLVRIPAGHVGGQEVVTRWKEDMSSPRTLAGLLRHARHLHPGAGIVLALEGHGAGYFPDIDRTLLTNDVITGNGQFTWHIGAKLSNVFDANGQPAVSTGSPILPATCPTLPNTGTLLSTWGLGDALRQATDGGESRIATIHLNNCFNLSVELLHTIAPYADYAAAYANYNFFTAGEPYPEMFRQVQQAGAVTAEQLAQSFADANHALLAAKGNHPTIGGVVQLARLQEISERVDDLADALLSALRTALPAYRPVVVETIKEAIIEAKQYDTEPGFQLETPDQLTDLASLANALAQPSRDFGPHGVKEAALALLKSLDGIKRYGDDDRPWIDPNVQWDFSEKTLAMNILLPDPLLEGEWDWRSPYYLDTNPRLSRQTPQRDNIEFVKVTDWVDFIIEYHKDVAFHGLLPAHVPAFPAFNAKYQPPRDDDGGCGKRCCTPGSSLPDRPGARPAGGDRKEGNA